MSNEPGLKYPDDGISFRSPTLLFPAFTTFTDGSIMHAWKGHLAPPVSPLQASGTAEAPPTEGRSLSDRDQGRRAGTRDGVRIRRTVVRLTGEMRVKATAKTAKSAGWVPLSPTLAEMIGPPRTGYVVPGIDKRTPCYPDTFERTVKKVLARAKVTVPHGGPHALRRTYGMMLLEAGVDVVTAAECMRHDPAILMREYARSRTDLKREAVIKAFGSHTVGLDDIDKENQR